jgi:hypothetical protein
MPNLAPLELEDPLAGATARERLRFTEVYGPVSLLEMCRRLDSAEAGIAYQRSEIERLTAHVKVLDRLVNPPDRSVPPDGWQLPKAAADLLACAQEHGWRTLTSWGERPGGDPMVGIQLAHDGWSFTNLTWVVSGSGRSMSRLGSGLQKTPAHTGWADAPPLAKIRAVIAANPAVETAAPQGTP